MDVFHSLILKRDSYDDPTFNEIMVLLLKLELYLRNSNYSSDMPIIKRIWEGIFFGIVKESTETPQIWNLVHGNLVCTKNLGYIVQVWSVFLVL